MKKCKILLTILLILLTTLIILPVEAQTGARILVRSLPDRPVAGSTWTLTLLIDHGEPNEVEILAPHFDEAIFLEQVLKTPRLVNPRTAEIETAVSAPQEYLERWTVMEYRFVLSSHGTVSFDVFTVITPRGQSVTTPFTLNIQRPSNTAAVQNYQFVWEGMPSELKTGENAVFTLRYANYANSLPQAGQFLSAATLLPTIPPGYILESISPSSAEAAAGIALKLRLIPLEANTFSLARRQFSHNGAIFEVPALRIPVSQAAQNPAAQKESAAAKNNAALPFPAPGTAIHDNPKFYAVYTAAKNLWDGGWRANALAQLRQNERDHQDGALFAAIRREAEQTLGFTGTRDETQTHRRSLFGTRLLAAKPRAAVLRETVVRRIPDSAGEEIARFREGQPVLLNGKIQKTWVQVTANDDNGTSGWVSEENIIFY